MATVTIRVPQATHQRLRQLSEKRGRPIGEIVDEAARKLEDADFWAEVDASYVRLYDDPAARAEYEAELALWDSTLMDGLEEYPYEGIDELIERVEPKTACRSAS
jgi:hypothetical protein